MSQVELSSVHEALGRVLDPVFERPMLEIGTLKNLVVDGKVVRGEVTQTSPSAHFRDLVETRVREALAPMGGLTPSLTYHLSTPTREVMADDPLPGVRNVILVMSGKGGVGKSTTSVNLTLALKRLGLRVGLLDADIYGPSIPTMMGISGHPVSRDGKRIAPLERFDVKTMSIGFLLEDEKQAIVWRGPMLHGALSQFLTDVDWGELDYLVLDLPPGTGDVALTMAQRLKVSGTIIVTTPQEVALQDVYKSVSMCGKLNLPVIGVVENMSYFIDTAGVKHELFGRGGGEKVAEFAEAPLLGQIPMETDVREWGDKGMPVVVARPDSTVSAAFLSIAEALTEAVAKAHFERSGGVKAPKEKGPTRLKIVR